MSQTKPTRTVHSGYFQNHQTPQQGKLRARQVQAKGPAQLSLQQVWIWRDINVIYLPAIVLKWDAAYAEFSSVWGLI